MNSRLEQFVRDHREEFDGEEPDNKIWEKIRTDMIPQKKKQGMLVRLGRAGWAAAAAVVLVAVGSVWYFSSRTTTVAPAVVQNNPQTTAPADTTPPPPAGYSGASPAAVAATTPTTPDSSKAVPGPTLASIRPKTVKES